MPFASVISLLAGLKNILSTPEVEFTPNEPACPNRFRRTIYDRDDTLKKLSEQFSEEEYTMKLQHKWVEINHAMIRDEFVYIEGPVGDEDLKLLPNCLHLHGSCVTNKGLKRIIEDWFREKRYNVDIKITKNFEPLNLDDMTFGLTGACYPTKYVKMQGPDGKEVPAFYSPREDIRDIKLRALTLTAFEGGVHLESEYGISSTTAEVDAAPLEGEELNEHLRTTRVLVFHDAISYYTS